MVMMMTMWSLCKPRGVDALFLNEYVLEVMRGPRPYVPGINKYPNSEIPRFQNLDYLLLGRFW